MKISRRWLKTLKHNYAGFNMGDVLLLVPKTTGKAWGYFVFSYERR